MQTIAGIFSGFQQVELVHVFGSRAKGNYKPGSDIDLAVMNGGLDIKTLARLKSQFSDSAIPYTVDLVDYPSLNNPDFIDHIKLVGILFYQRPASNVKNF